MKTLFTFLLLTLGWYTSIFSQDFPDEFCTCEKQTIQSKILDQDRIIFIYLPTDYYQDTSQKYPVHYVSDAPATSNLYYDLIRLNALMNDIPQSIVVGLSSDNRNEHFNINAKAPEYLEFIQSEVIPFMEKNYRTQDYKVFAGHSAGGDFVLYTYLNDPQLFNAYIAGSPGPIEQIIEYIKSSTVNLPTNDYRFLFTSIGSQDFTDTQSFKLLESLMHEIADEQHEYHFKINQDENHLSNIAINFQKGFLNLYKDWKYHLPDQLELPVSQLLRDHYQKLEEKFGYPPKIGEWEVIFPIMDQLAKRGDFNNAIDILKYGIELHPDSDQAYAFLAKAHFDTAQFEAGKKYLEKALQLNPENQYALQIKMMLENR